MPELRRKPRLQLATFTYSYRGLAQANPLFSVAEHLEYGATHISLLLLFSHSCRFKLSLLRLTENWRIPDRYSFSTLAMSRVPLKIFRTQVSLSPTQGVGGDQKLCAEHGGASENEGFGVVKKLESQRDGKIIATNAGKTQFDTMNTKSNGESRFKRV
jgi:hypothetical protein